MTWIRVSDDFYDNPKIMEVGAQAVGLWVAAMGWCNRNRTDGVIPRMRLRPLLTGVEDETLLRLVDVGLLHGDGHDCPNCVKPPLGSYVVHDYLHYQDSRQKIEAKVAATKERVKKYRESRNGTRNAVTGEDVTGQYEESTGTVQTPHTHTHSHSKVTTDVVTSVAAVKPQKAKRGQNKTEVDPNYLPPESLRQSMSEELGVSREQLGVQHRQFIADALAHGRKYVRWDQAWANWMRRAKGFGNFNGTVNGTKLATSDLRIQQSQALLEVLRAEQEHAAINNNHQGELTS